MRLLATKLLSHSLKNSLIQQGHSLIEYPFIEIKPLPFQIDSLHDNLIFTSQNAVKIAFSNSQIRPLLNGKKYYCVGEKTKSILEENGQKVLKKTDNSADLASFLAKNNKKESFSFFCGKRRRPEIETFFAASNSVCQIHETYDTLLTPKPLKSTFDGILFFSPSAVHSFFEVNTWNRKTHGFCIGKTTASALESYTQNYSIPSHPTETDLLLTIHKYHTQPHAQK